MPANTLTPVSAVHNVTQAAGGTVDQVTFSRPGFTLWIYNRGASDITLVARPYTPAAAEGDPVRTLADPVALAVDTFVVPAGQAKSFTFQHAIDRIKLIAGASMTYDAELL